MLNKRFFSFLAMAAAVLLSFSAEAQTLTPAPVASVPDLAASPPIVAEGPLTVTDVAVDRTDKDAVAAKEYAITEAQRLAFRKLAGRFMSPDTFRTYQMPDDKTIMTLVEDFEIKNEQISANRYIANVTVRFNADAASAIRSAGGTVPEISSAPPSAPVAQMMPMAPVVAAAAPVAAPAESRTVLVLPYLKLISGKKILWEEPNLWRDAWTNATSSPGLTLLLPAGDSADVAAGSEDSVWIENYSTVEALRNKYKASEVILPVANKSGLYMQVDIYLYKDGVLQRQKSFSPYTGAQDDASAFGATVSQVVQMMQPEPSLSAAPSTAPEALAVPAGAPEKITLDTSVRFDSFMQWLEVQKRLTSISPTLTIEISSLNKNAAQFTISVETAGGFEGFKNALAAKNLELDAPISVVGETADAAGKTPQRPLYILKMN